MSKIQIHNFEQGTPEWFEIRKNKITSTTIKTLIFGTNAAKNQLLEEYKNPSNKSFYSKATEHGKFYEDKARALYEMEARAPEDVSMIEKWDGNINIKKLSLKEVGFVTRSDSPFVGGSPDGIWFDENEKIVGGVEIKCPYSLIAHEDHLMYGLRENYQWQVKFLMWLCDANFWDFVSYFEDKDCPVEDKLFIQRVYLNGEDIRIIEYKIEEFEDKITTNSKYDQITARGVLDSGTLEDYLKRGE